MKMNFINLAFAMLVLVSTSKAQDTSKIQVNWMSWEEAVAKNSITPKKLYIDVYTDWCGYCKMMDKNTFTDQALAKFLNENFYAVKFNAEQKKEIEWNGRKFNLKPGGRNGTHELAVAMLNGKTGYPSFVVFTEKLERVLVAPGYKDAQGVMRDLKFVTDETYKTMTYDTFINSGQF